MITHAHRSRTYGRRVRIVGGMAEFIGKIGTVIGREGPLLRVRLDEPVEVENVGRVTDELWEPRLLKTYRATDVNP
jgi:hypothetical protein